MATMADVARLAGVSIATVSHVVNGTRTVREQTRRAVQEAIDATGYSPNTLARSLATASTSSIAIVIPAITNPHYGQILQGIESEAVDHDYTVLLAESQDDPERELHVVRSMRARRVDGIILAPSAAPARALNYLEAQRLPTVLVDRLVDPRYDQIGTENVEATASLVDHLARTGHCRIGLVAGRRGVATTEERVRGYRDGLRRNGIEGDPDLIVAGRSETASATEATLRLLGTSEPTALITANNDMTIGAMQALVRSGHRVPDDIALVGYDDFPWADVFTPRLTVIAQPCHDIGTEASRLLMRRISDPDAEPDTHRALPRFIHRDSCGCTTESATR